MEKCTLVIDNQNCLERGWDSDEEICMFCAKSLRTIGAIEIPSGISSQPKPKKQ